LEFHGERKIFVFAAKLPALKPPCYSVSSVVISFYERVEDGFLSSALFLKPDIHTFIRIIKIIQESIALFNKIL